MISISAMLAHVWLTMAITERMKKTLTTSHSTQI
jgi:hypothetical protein